MVTNSFRKKNKIIQPMRRPQNATIQLSWKSNLKDWPKGKHLCAFIFVGGWVGFRVNPNPNPKPKFFFFGEKT